LSFVGPPGESIAIYTLILLSAIGMGIQGIAARHINATGINTIVFTSTLISIVSALTEKFINRSADSQLHFDIKRQIRMLLAYGIGAVLAGILARSALRFIGWIPMLAFGSAVWCCHTVVNVERARGERLQKNRGT